MATIRDVAGLAGVSISTVSLALNTPERVSADTLRKVLDAALQVGFTANPIAQSLKRGRSRLIGLVVADITNPFFGRLLREIEFCAKEAGYMVVINDTLGSPENERAIIRHMAGQRVAGLILALIGDEPASIDLLESLPMPFVMFDHRVSGIEADYVGSDNVLACSMLTEHLVRLGHTRIAYIGGTAGVYTAEKRKQGFEETMHAHNLPVEPELCADGRYEWQGGYDAAMRLLTRPGDRPTAILAASNSMAVGALQALNDLSICCPDAVSLVGIDDLPWSAVIRPRITTAVQLVDEMARAACAMLMERMTTAQEDLIRPRDVVFMPRLLIGESTARRPD